ncbi:tRNA (cytidine(56)-2'-O)-methyltransferase [Methanocaldococcus lauensis]|uniref:tRNA (cytidine(56)-2'-O)-methyltransferase n=1 Tax=Methanocaldococcus lauensis TaxID=2546128 RepID=A0A8D6PX66_9EURY|nr:tRNA (cytidine(56)-2'-O)-methyltransferase [Methanocaldococcus lauensis]CAB3287598.1 tRNA (cytidine(56)-2'-O)-methyltransferase [Methanocaldococcus lauensis]
MVVEVLRLGHRGDRDKRISTHVALTARALGADKIIFTVEDKDVESSVKKVVENWGGDFKFTVEKNWRRYIREFKNRGIVVHLTMYGANVNEIMPEVRELSKDKDILVIVGAEKVPKDVYELADYNISIGNQPHSEVAALAIFLDRLFEGKTLYRDFENAKIKIIPSNDRKVVIRNK